VAPRAGAPGCLTALQGLTAVPSDRAYVHQRVKELQITAPYFRRCLRGA